MPQAARAARDDEARVGDSTAESGRRTVTITGHPGGLPSRHLRALPARPSAGAGALSRRVVHVERRRPARRAHERLSSRPDRLAMWAVMMALLLIVITAVSAHS